MKLFVYNKNPDLHCISAKEALEQTMGIDTLSHLQRYTVWNMDFRDNSKGPDALTNALSQSYLLSNPNKHHHSIGSPNKKNNDYWYVEVEKQEQNEDNDIKDALNKSFNTGISKLTQTIVWEVGLSKENNTKDYITEKIALTKNQQNGLLVNPLYETARIVKANEL